MIEEEILDSRREISDWGKHQLLLMLLLLEFNTRLFLFSWGHQQRQETHKGRDIYLRERSACICVLQYLP